MNSEILEVVARSFYVSSVAILIASIFAIPLAVYISLAEFKGKKIILAIINSFLAIPAVAIGLFCYLLLARSGFLGFFHLLYTANAMIMAQALLAFPIILALATSGLQTLAKPLRDTLLSLGLGRIQTAFSLLFELRKQAATAIIMAFSRVIGETGMTLMVGGNIKGATRVMTTTIAMETMKGNFELAISLGLILLSTAIILNIVVQLLLGETHAPAM
jgi:tungstate transport system permease protein